VKTPDILADLSRSWNRNPEGVVVGTTRTGVSAALWASEKDEVQETVVDPHPSLHVLCLPLTNHVSEFRLNGRPTYQGRMRPGTASLTQSGEHLWGAHHGRWQALHLYIPQIFIAATVQEDEVWGGRTIELIDPAFAHDAIIERIGRDVVSEINQNQPMSGLRIDALGQDLAVQLLRRWSNLGGAYAIQSALAKGGLAAWQQRRATEYLSERLGEDVALVDLAATSGLSAFHFARMFKRSTGLTPQAYQRRLRCERAKELLAMTPLSVGEIAAAVGYDTPQAFARMFRADVGVSPSEYRRERRS
jgi:AraC-like DNA-binding protein